MTSSRSLLLARVLAVPFLVAYGAWAIVDDEMAHDDLYDGLGAGLGAVIVVAALPVLFLALAVLRSRRPRVAAASGVVLAVLPVVVAVLMNGDYAPWPALTAVLGAVLGVACVPTLVAAPAIATDERIPTAV